MPTSASASVPAVCGIHAQAGPSDGGEEDEPYTSVIEDLTPVIQEFRPTAPEHQEAGEWQPCTCKRFNGQPCFSRYTKEEIESCRLSFMSLTKEELDVAIMAKIQVCIHLGSETQRTKKAQTPRQQQQVTAMTKPKGPAGKYSQSSVEKALDAIQSKSLSIRQAAQTYGVPRSTLMDKLSGKYPVKRVAHTVLTEEEETKLVKWVVACARLGDGKDREQLCRAVQGILNSEGRQTKFTNNKPGFCWYKAFMEKHEDIIRERKAMVLGEQRAQVSKIIIIIIFV
ncbi:uncharacterized protein LOC106012062 [Aplysia californica]|uniref:Uncharacterized protein LOC106012062 n=1 Tax=Aplysia californica TaxID=6500 RepID=A0ABM1A212_APLCA|nr:uncharacterized protein LOC106012062 [Aplysia californica]